MGFRCQMKPKTPSGAARFSYINRTGKYARDKADLVHTADHNMPDFARKDAMLFWEAADEFERSNARICLEFELNLPTELNLKQQIECVEKFINSLDTKAGNFPTSYAIHNDKDGQNPHVHLMISERNLDGIDRPAELFFKRANTKKPELGGTKKSLFFNRSSENVLWTRASWAESCNTTLIDHGFDARFDSRTKAAQRLEAIEIGDIRKAVRLSTLTEIHEGPHVGGIRKRLEVGRLTRDEVDAEILEKLDSNDTIKDFNRELKLFAAVAEIEQLQAFLECEKPAERMAFIADLYTPKPASELDEQKKDLEYEHDFRAQFSTDGNSNTNSKGVYEHTQALYVMQARRNNQILQGLDSQRQAGDFRKIRDSVFTPVQPDCATAHSSLLTIRGLEAQPLALPELEKAYSKADRDAFDAELAELEEQLREAQRAAEHAELTLDMAQCAFDDLKEQRKQLNAKIAESKPVGINRVLVLLGITNDDSKVLQSELVELQKRIKQDAEAGKKLGPLSVELRTHADELLERVEAVRLQQQQQPEQQPARENQAQAETTQAPQSALDSFFESRGFAEALEAPAQAQEAKRPSPRRGPGL